MNAVEDHHHPSVNCRSTAVNTMHHRDFAPPPIYNYEAHDYFDGRDSGDGIAPILQRRKRCNNDIDREKIEASLAYSPEDYISSSVSRNYIRYDPHGWGQRADSRHITEHLYGPINRWISKAAKRYPLLLYAIPKFKRDGERNHDWQRAVLRVHAYLCPKPPQEENDGTLVTNISNEVYGSEGKSIEFRKCSPAAKNLKILTDDVLWETYIDIEMIPLGEDHVNGDKIFASPLPSVPSYNNTIKSFQLCNHDLEGHIYKEHYNKGRILLDKFKLDNFEFRIECVPYEPTDTTKVVTPESYISSDAGNIRLEDGTTINPQVAKSLWNDLSTESDTDLKDRVGMYQFSWPAHLKIPESCGRIFTLRDGCTEDGNALLSVGVTIRLIIDKGSSWDESKPYLHFFNELTGLWMSKDFTPETPRCSNTYIAADLQVRRMIFVIGDRNDERRWIKAPLNEDFLIPFAGAFEINSSADKLKRISGGSMTREVIDSVPFYRTTSSLSNCGELIKGAYDPVDFFKLEDGSCLTEECSVLGNDDIFMCEGDDSIHLEEEEEKDDENHDI